MLAAGLLAGVMAGLFGIGGGVVIVPVLEAVLQKLGVDPSVRMHVAVATSLATIIPTSIASARAHHQRGAVDFSLFLRWAPFVAAGAVLGAWLAASVDSRVLAIVFASTATLVAINLAADVGRFRLLSTPPPVWLVFPLPLAIGAVSTLMGIGGGVLSVVAQRLLGQAIHRAIGTAALLGLAISLPGAIGLVVGGWNDPRLPAMSAGFVSLPGLLAIAPMTVVSAPIGARIAHRLPDHWLNRLFAGFLVLVAIRLFWQAFA